MKAILICPWTKTIVEVNIDAEHFNDQVYQLLSQNDLALAGGGYQVDTYQPLRIGDSQVLLVDENARLYKDEYNLPHWYWFNSNVPIYGKALCVSMGETDFTGTALTEAYVKCMVGWQV